MEFSRGLASLALATAGVLTSGSSSADAALLLAVDVNSATLSDGSTIDSGTEAGYTSYVRNLNNPVDVGNGYTMVVSGIGGTVLDRDRHFQPVPPYYELYDDFIFNNSNTGSLTVSIGGGALQPNTQYEVVFYAYDHSSGGLRTAAWVDTNNANALVANVNFVGGTAPTGKESYMFTGLAVTNASGVLSLQGDNVSTPPTNGSIHPDVFLSGIEVHTVPEPTGALALIGVAGLVMARRRTR